MRGIFWGGGGKPHPKIMVERRRNCPGLRRGFLRSAPKWIPSERSALPMPSFFPVGSGEELVPRKMWKKCPPKKGGLQRVPPATLCPLPQRHTAIKRHGSTPPNDGVAKQKRQGQRRRGQRRSPKWLHPTNRRDPHKLAAWLLAGQQRGRRREKKTDRQALGNQCRLRVTT